MKRGILCIMAALVFCLSACVRNELSPPISPEPTPAHSIPIESPITPAFSPTPIVMPSSPSINPTPTIKEPEKIYSAEEFFSLDEAFVLYSLDDETTQESYAEYIDKGRNSLQRRFLSSTANRSPYVEILQLTDVGIVLSKRLESIGYTHNFIPTYSINGKYDEVLLMEPIKLGNEWEIPGGLSEITAIDKQVNLPIGEASIIEVTTLYADGTLRVHQFSKSYGLCARYYYDDQGTLKNSFELAERETGRSFKQNIRFYFADQSDWSIKFINRQVNIKAGTNMSQRFSDELKKVPSGSYLAALPPKSKIINVNPSYKGGIMVNLSKEFVTQMQVGRNGEKLMLQALANTFGEYYQAKKVYFRVEGDLYESPYLMLINENEHFIPTPQNAKRYTK